MVVYVFKCQVIKVFKVITVKFYTTFFVSVYLNIELQLTKKKFKKKLDSIGGHFGPLSLDFNDRLNIFFLLGLCLEYKSGEIQLIRCPVCGGRPHCMVPSVLGGTVSVPGGGGGGGCMKPHCMMPLYDRIQNTYLFVTLIFTD